MIQVLIYSMLLIAGMFVSQMFELSGIHSWISTATVACLAYIMIEVGLEFTLDKKRLKSYGWDFLVAWTAAVLPWIFCAGYFMFVFHTSWKEALLVGAFAAPTSAGILFAMLAAAGLGTTWVFRKAQVLAIFDDLDTVLLMIPLQMIFVGLKLELFFIAAIMFFLLAIAFYRLHAVKLPVGKTWLLIYALLLVALLKWVEHAAHIHLEILLPAFVLGCILFNPHHETNAQHQVSETRSKNFCFSLDITVKMLFMFLVGCSLPKISLHGITLAQAIMHILIITVLSNLGKCFPFIAYRSEVPGRERLALSLAMFPRGEVGAGVLLIALGYGLTGLPTTLSVISLALNLVLTGFFIAMVRKLISKKNVKII